MPRQNRVSNGSRPRMGNLGRVKAVTSNRERTSQSRLLFCTSVELMRFCRTSFSLGLHSRRISVLVTMSSTSSDSEMTFDSEDAEMYYIAEDMKNKTRGVR